MGDPIPLHPPTAASSAQGEPKPRPTVLRRSGNVITAAFGRIGRGRPIGLRLNTEELAFLPASLEIIETPASPTLRWTAGVLCGLIAAAIAWSCFAHLDMVAVAPGRVVPLGRVKVVQPLETATIRAIHVDDGDHVEAGQVLVDLDPTEAQADLTTLGYDRGEALLDAAVARVLLASQNQAGSSVPSRISADPTGDQAEHIFVKEASLQDLPPTRIQQAWAQAAEEQGKHRSEMADLAAQIAEKHASLAANAAQVTRAKAVLPLLEDRYATAKGLFEKGIAPKPPMLEADQQLLERRGDLQVAEETAEQIGAETRALEARRDATETAFQAAALDRLAKAEAKREQLDGEIAKAREKLADRHLVAPVAGTIQGVTIHTTGAVVTAADVLMRVVPDGAGLEIEAEVENKDIGFVREGQTVAIKVDAFPFTRYGLLHGLLLQLGRDANQTGIAASSLSSASIYGQGTAPQAAMTYPAKVSLDQDWIDADGRRERLQPGMRVEAEIRTGDRRVIEYLLSPLMHSIREAGRER